MIEHEEPTEEAIRKRAYEISQRANGGSPEENWRLAREELRDEAWSAAREADARSAQAEHVENSLDRAESA